jgi:hypothetical protein
MRKNLWARSFFAVSGERFCGDPGRAAMTAEEQATLATIGANVEMRERDLRDFVTAWRGGGHS